MYYTHGIIWSKGLCLSCTTTLPNTSKAQFDLSVLELDRNALEASLKGVGGGKYGYRNRINQIDTKQ